jgi:tetratricopeptide (TPR) repeat protein
MANSGRNNPCPCGSGKKYKRCCLEKDAAREREALAASVKQPDLLSPWARSPEVLAEMREAFAAATGNDDDDDELETASNAAVDLVQAGKLDEAEKAARDLLRRFPEVHDGYDRLGMVYEARGQPKEAADCYRKVIEIIRANGDAYDQQFADVFVKLVAKLDPPAGSP